MKRCTTMECYSIAVGQSTISEHYYCIQCCLRIIGQHGPESIKTLPGAVFPWEAPATHVCKNCGLEYNHYVIGLTGDCPKCRKPLPEIDSVYKK